MYDGAPEDSSLYHELERRFDGDRDRLSFVTYDVDVDIARDRPYEMHNMSRVCGYEHAVHANPCVSWVLFLDGDEVPDGESFSVWWRTNTRDSDVAYKFSNYWYFLLSTLRADQTEDSVLMIHSKNIRPHTLLYGERERDSLLQDCPSVHRRMVDRSAGSMFHHFSWVRSRKDLVKKVTTWGHKGDRPWKQLLEHCWAMMDEMGVTPRVDFVHGYRLVVVDDMFGLSTALNDCGDAHEDVLSTA